LYIVRLELENFRNFSKLKHDFSPSGALIHGKNGIGKTNLLEAISFFSTGKSFLTRNDSDLIKFQTPYSRILANFIYRQQSLKFEAGLEPSQKKIRLNKNYLSRTSELYEYLKIIYFSPSDIEFISGSPSLRRNFLDQAISQYSFAYVGLMRKFYRVLKQRNNLLKTGFTMREKSSWDKQFIDLAEEINRTRLDYLNDFIPQLKEHYQKISLRKEVLGIAYVYSFPRLNLDNYRRDLHEFLNKKQKDEIQYQHTLAGPHLDDLSFELNGHSARKFASQGQKRSIAIASRLVQSEMITQKEKSHPILMFDDVLADLDRDRARSIMKILQKKHQIFIATPNAQIYQDFDLEKIDLEKVR